jgi:phospholipase/carboxylesterase
MIGRARCTNSLLAGLNMKKVILVILVLGLAKWWFTDPTISVPTNDVSFSYIVKYSGNSGRNDKLPMLVALHGNGDTPNNFYNTTLNQLNSPARIVLLKGPIPHGSGSAWPWSAADFSRYGKAINEAVELLALKYLTIQKPILLGFSGGGMVAYYQAVKHGNSYSYVFPVSGQLSNDLLGEKLFRQGAKVFAFHGKNDSVVSLGGGRKAVNILQENGVEVEYVEFDGGHHGIFTNMKREITQAIEQKIQSLR